MRTKGILARFTLAYFLLIFVTMVAIGSYIARVLDDLYLDRIESTLASDGRLIGELVRDKLPRQKSQPEPESQLGAPDRLAVQKLVQRVAKESEARVTVIAVDGTVLGDSQEDPRLMENHRDRPEIAAALKGRLGKSTRYSRTLRAEMTYVAQPVISDGRVAGVVRLALPLIEVNRLLGNIQLLILRGIVLAMLLSAVLGYLLATRLTRPLREMAHAVQQISGKKLGERLEVESDDEIGRLAGAFNEMAGRLERIVQDISEERNKLDAILASMPDGVIAVDQERKIILFNSAAEKLFGVGEKSALGRHILEVIRNYELAQVFEAPGSGQEAWTQEVNLFTPEERVLRAYATSIRGQQREAAGIVVVLHDITELRRLEQIRTEFVSNVSHELRTPLTSIKGFTETLLDGTLEDPSTARRFLEIIDREADRLVRLISDLLDLSRIESKKVELKRRPLELGAVVERGIAVLAAQAQAKGIAVSAHLPQDLPRVLADEDMLGQVLINLLDNALKYTPFGGKVEISARVEEGKKNAGSLRRSRNRGRGKDRDREGKALVAVTVADTGIGIPREKLPRLFERFYRVDKARSRELGGTGLGLSIVKHIVERHGGTVSVESEVGRGSRFTFTMPVA